jgi:hypothetical protein
MAENRELALVLKLVADQFQSELKKSQGALGGFNSFINDWKTQTAAAGTVLFAITKSTANFGEEALKTSQRLGTTVEQTTALQYAASLADIPMSTLEKGLKGLAQTAVEAANGTGEGARLFHAMGLSATDAHGQIKPLDQLFFEVQDRLKGVGNQAQFVDAGVKVFGKSFLEMVPLIKQGSAATKEAMEEGRQFGVVMSTSQAEAANRFNDELKKLNAQVTGLKLSVGNELIPVTRELIELFRTLGVGTGLSEGLKFIHEQFIRMNTLLKELQANSQFLFGTGKDALSFSGLKDKIDAIEGDAKKKLFEFRHPGVLTAESVPASGGGSGAGASLPLLADQEKLGKALLEIHLAMNRAIDIENKLRTEGADIYRLQTDRQIQREKEDGDYQERQGRRLVEETQLEVRLRDEARQKEQQGLVDNLQAWIAYHEQVGGSAELRYTKEVDLVRASLAKQLDLTTEETGRLLIAWQNHDEQLATSILSRTALTEQQRETLQLQTLTKISQANEKASDDVFAGWARGMQRYVEDTKSGFGLGADMARRTAQAMEQSFRTFFFDLFEGRVKSFKDVLRGVLDFVKQVAAQVASQLAVSFLLKSFSGGGGGFADFFSGFFGGEKSGPSVTSRGLFGETGGMLVQRFAGGGPVMGAGNRDTVPAWLAPGEFVLSRRDVGDVLRGQSRQSSAPANVIVNIHGAPSDSTASVDVRRTTDAMVIDVLMRHQRDLRPLFGGA